MEDLCKKWNESTDLEPRSKIGKNGQSIDIWEDAVDEDSSMKLEFKNEGSSSHSSMVSETTVDFVGEESKVDKNEEKNLNVEISAQQNTNTNCSETYNNLEEKSSCDILTCDKTDSKNSLVINDTHIDSESLDTLAEDSKLISFKTSPIRTSKESLTSDWSDSRLRHASSSSAESEMRAMAINREEISYSNNFVLPEESFWLWVNGGGCWINSSDMPKWFVDLILFCIYF